MAPAPSPAPHDRLKVNVNFGILGQLLGLSQPALLQQRLEELQGGEGRVVL